MKTAFLTEMGFTGKIPQNHTNMRTEFAWMHALDSDHYSIYNISSVKDYDEVFIIFPKGNLFLNAVGAQIGSGVNPVSPLLQLDLVSILKQNGNKCVSYIQEGPHWIWNEYDVIDQVGFYNLISNCDKIYAHNQSDVPYYRGLFGDKVKVIPTLMIEDSIKDIVPTVENKVIIGGNFARWYGGFESYIVASEFNLPIWAQTSHAMRENESQMENLHHLPRLMWLDWMKALSSFKYAVHLMPTVAAGTFSLNCAYFGIPTIGNISVDTQRICHPNLSVEVNDVYRARELAKLLLLDDEFYTECSTIARKNYRDNYTKETFLQKLDI